jgi:hypothetical protein
MMISCLLVHDDLVPLPQERARIEEAGGHVEAAVGDAPARLFFANGTLPGLAVSRSLGDHAARRIGVIAEPAIAVHERASADRFLVLASDGVWAVLSPQEVGGTKLSSSSPHHLISSLSSPHRHLIAVITGGRHRRRRGARDARLPAAAAHDDGAVGRAARRHVRHTIEPPLRCVASMHHRGNVVTGTETTSPPSSRT